MPAIVTTRDLYFAVAQLIQQYEGRQRPLEEYLRALWNVAHRYRERAALTPDEFCCLLTEAFTGQPESLSDAFCNAVADFLHELDGQPGYYGFETRLFRQIIDLREMAEAGQLADPQRYFGIDAPRGSRWYNFDPCTFLECAVAGTFGGQDGADPDREAIPLGEITWEQFRDFLLSGQAYE